MRFIGCKNLLLDNIFEVAQRHAPEANSFCDIFSGSSVVARHFKQWYEVYSNDLLYFSYCLQKATIENDMIPTFKTLINNCDLNDPIEYFNTLSNYELESLAKEKRFFQNNYSPIGGRMYITDSNALRIDFARNKIEQWFDCNLITQSEYFYLIACIVEGIPFVSNISGTYGAFHKTWDKRAYKTFELIRLPVNTNNRANKSFNCDGIDLIKTISGDILYIDPPYNERQYLPNYHVLETAARYDFPTLRGITGQREYTNEKSTFCSKKSVLESFEKLISNAKFKHIILSYNTDGIMNINDIELIMKKYGISDTFEINRIPYRRYKSRVKSNISEELSEMLIYIKKEV